MWCPPAEVAEGWHGERTPGARQQGRHVSIPNLISLGRVILVPVIFWLLLTGQTQLAFFTFVIAGVSDAVDGYLAKTYHWETELGAYLDPLADKLLIVSIFVALGVKGELPLWLVIAVVSRDILIIVGVVLTWLLGRPAQIKPLIVSKANTAAQIVLAALVLADEGFGLGLENLRTVMVWITGALTIASLAAYLDAWLRHMSGPEENPGQDAAP
jgi:cardiolipin synthase (CMP-forming)